MSRFRLLVMMCLGGGYFWPQTVVSMDIEGDMSTQRSFAERVVQFDEKLANVSLKVPAGFKVLNPFQGPQQDAVRASVHDFYSRYYNDDNLRRMVLGSSPARRGSAVSGIPFEDQKSLHAGTAHAMAGSSDFLSDVIETYGGREKFYLDFYMGFVCPLGIVRTKPGGGEVNCNYYEDKKLLKVLSPFILETLKEQLAFGIDRTVCYCIGSGDNYNFLAELNAKHHFFDNIVALEHPRYIMQYHSKERSSFVKKYIDAFRAS